MVSWQLITARSDDEAVNHLDEESRKKREVLARRPSYRKILNELSSADLTAITSQNSSGTSDVKSESSTSDVETTAISVGGQYSLKVSSSQAYQRDGPCLQASMLSADSTAMITWASLRTSLRSCLTKLSLALLYIDAFRCYPHPHSNYHRAMEALYRQYR